MNEVVILFPGVGSEYTGMGKDFYDLFPRVQNIFAKASRIIGRNLSELCFNTTQQSNLKSNEFSRYALLTLNYAIFKVFQETLDLPIGAIAGYSFGEYLTLCTGGVLSFAETLELVRERNQVITSQGEQIQGTMMWVIQVDSLIVEAICGDLQEQGYDVFLSAYNSPLKTAISGTREALSAIIPILEAEGGILYPLQIDGPYHSPLMKEASKELALVLDKYDFRRPNIPIISNVTGKCTESKTELKELLIKHLNSPIKWMQTIETIQHQGWRKIIEIGPKEVLTYLVKDNTEKLKILSLNKVSVLEELVDHFEVKG